MKTSEDIVKEIERRIGAYENIHFPSNNILLASHLLKDLLSWITQENNLDEKKE